MTLRPLSRVNSWVACARRPGRPAAGPARAISTAPEAACEGCHGGRPVGAGRLSAGGRGEAGYPTIFLAAGPAHSRCKPHMFGSKDDKQRAPTAERRKACSAGSARTPAAGPVEPPWSPAARGRLAECSAGGSAGRRSGRAPRRRTRSPSASTEPRAGEEVVAAPAAIDSPLPPLAAPSRSHARAGRRGRVRRRRRSPSRAHPRARAGPRRRARGCRARRRSRTSPPSWASSPASSRAWRRPARASAPGHGQPVPRQEGHRRRPARRAGNPPADRRRRRRGDHRDHAEPHQTGVAQGAGRQRRAVQGPAGGTHRDPASRSSSRCASSPASPT